MFYHPGLRLKILPNLRGSGYLNQAAPKIHTIVFLHNIALLTMLDDP